ncbi:division/cell wall cluster transcriptional repressor MraZ [Sphingopyxis indica]|uniref:MraZ protein n=1 Tax=Sphingopyxis indica TaxID=436663 RepID=A0A239G0J6_9SPHN|nr:division/cell wall cluster transcriptional repressor MraZ [Sphingopyxis indica]SNS61993.1 MraZ protein [Sphingopyxis indica]
MAVVTPGRYSGTNFAVIDGKGRIAVPSQFRNNVPLNADGQRVLWVGFHEKLPCLVAYGQDQYDRLSDEIERDRAAALARNLDFDEDEAFKQRFSYTEAYTLDDSGRFLPNFTARDRVGETGATAFVGSGRRFEIWWLPTLAECAAADPVLQRLAANWAETKGRARK